MTHSSRDKTSFSSVYQETGDKEELVSMSAQQKRFGEAKNPLKTYICFVVGERGVFSFLKYELLTLLFSNLSGLLGYVSRRFLYPSLFKKTGKGITFGRALVLRQAESISLGSKTIIDDGVTLDVRSSNGTSDSSIEIGKNVFIGKHSIIAAKGGNISLGDACNISSNCRIATQSKITIGKSVLIASYVYIGPGNHGTDLEKPIIEQDMQIKGGVEIGANVWIGTRATIVDGVRIGKDAIVGAHSLVLEDVPEKAVVAGTPAKIIRYR